MKTWVSCSLSRSISDQEPLTLSLALLAMEPARKRRRFTVVSSSTGSRPLSTLAALSADDGKALWHFKARVMFMSLVGKTQKRDTMLKLEVLDPSVGAPTKLTIIGDRHVEVVITTTCSVHSVVEMDGVRCSQPKDEVMLICNLQDPMTVKVVAEDASYPDVEDVETCLFTDKAVNKNVLVHVIETANNALHCRDIVGNIAVICLMREAEGQLQEVQGMRLCDSVFIGCILQKTGSGSCIRCGTLF
eukprot:1941002-Amphidinium_carterae.1